MTEATPSESQRPAFRWWGERDRIVIGRRSSLGGKRPAEPADFPAAADRVCEAA
ncbi:MAG: hypothetical protein AVDCRST_MAG68-4779 [uncultured Gemmatimonadetes bacterium]|uniref:Uncharacterized protein n=1 Tax=uncultured Gemmatimonadota bacterium TaxID=203437 RepID=A0A6J4MIZ7_9BACT|nr:MAG: hypothetical protein AVDCRST_MAG68-4779 [uncultured Gemmatimonadota bacterium]